MFHCHLSSILLTYDGPGSLFEKLNFAVGSGFVGVVKQCLTADNLDEDDGDEACIDLEIQVLEVLRRLKVDDR